MSMELCDKTSKLNHDSQLSYVLQNGSVSIF